jgi:hypothetical protein
MEEIEVKKRTYQDNKAGKKHIAVNLNCQLLGIWGTLKKACDEIRETDIEFPSYWTLVRKTDINPISVKTEKGEYQIYIEKLK